MREHIKKVIVPAATVVSLSDQPTKTGYYFAGRFTEINDGDIEFTVWILLPPLTPDAA